MTQPVAGMKVADIKDRPIGLVTSVAPCCIEVGQNLDAGELRLSRDCIFTVTRQAVTLICDRELIARYCCQHGLG